MTLKFHPWCVLGLSLFIFGNYHILGHPNGAPESICNTMIPDHGSSPQTSQNPYIIVLNKTTIYKGEKINITLKSETDIQFKGFLLQVRKKDEQTSNAYGEFVGHGVERNYGKPLNCFNKDNSGMTHTSNTPKKSVSVQWIAPNETGEYKVFFTVVGLDAREYWTAQEHPQVIRVSDGKPGEHGHRPGNDDDVSNKWREMHTGCGQSKGCFGIPGQCIETYQKSKSSSPPTCDIMVTWKEQGYEYAYELAGKPPKDNGFLAVGFSKDDKIGDDSVVGCDREGNEEFTVRRYYNKRGQKNGELVEQDQTLGIKQGTVDVDRLKDTVFYQFTQEERHEIGNSTWDFQKNKFYILLSNGRLNKGQLSYARIGISTKPAHVTDHSILVEAPGKSSGISSFLVSSSLMSFGLLVLGFTSLV